MHRFYFPPCPVSGPIEPPVPFFHLATEGAIPNKCGSCGMQFEGGCIRNMEMTRHYMHLDFGSCGIHGPTDPVLYEDRFIRAKVEVPRKCASCHFLSNDSIHGFTCRKDHDKWGGCYRGLDWGSWTPERIYIALPHPKVTTKALVDHLHDNNLPAFIKEHRRLNPGLSLAEAKEDFSSLRAKLELKSSEP